MTTEAPRKTVRRGFGKAMLDHLEGVDHASTEELAKVAGVDAKQAYSRLMFLQATEGVVTSAGKGAMKSWSLSTKAPPPQPTVTAQRAADTVSGAFNRSHGWKPDLARFQPVMAPVIKGDSLVAEFKEGWRHSSVVTVVREPDATGVAQCWDLRNKCYAYLPVTEEACERYGVRIRSVSGEKLLQQLENE